MSVGDLVLVNERCQSAMREDVNCFVIAPQSEGLKGCHDGGYRRVDGDGGGGGEGGSGAGVVKRLWWW